MDNSRYYLDGPGETLVRAIDASGNLSYSLAIVTAKTASLKTGVTQDKVTGGRSLFPRRKYTTEKTATFELEDCECDFRYFAMTQGEEVTESDANTKVWAFGDDQKYVVPSSSPYTVQLAAPGVPGVGLVIDSTSLVITRDTGELFTKVVATPGTPEYTFDPATNKLTFDVSNAGKNIKAVFQFTAPAHTKLAATKGDSLPRTVSLVHRMPAYDNNNVILGYQEVEIFRAQLGGDFEEAYAEKAAFAPKLSFEVIESGRTDNKLIEHRFIPANGSASVVVAVTGIMLNKAASSLTVGATETLVATIAPYAATNKVITWTSSDATKVTVTASGVIKGIAAGTATITATTADGNKTGTCSVTVA